MAFTQNVPTNLKQQANVIKEVWPNIDAAATYGDISLKEFNDLIDNVEKMEGHVKNLADQTMAARTTLTEQRQKLWDSVKRTRNGAKAKYGDNSNEYERFGGTKATGRGPRGKKPPAKPMS